MITWGEFFKRLEGPEGCDFKEDPELSWNCAGGTDQSLAFAILDRMGLTPSQRNDVLRQCSELGGHCDCEIVFNVREEFSDGEPLVEPPSEIPARLEYLRGELRAERISWGEIAELQSLASSIAPGDVELLEAAGVPEFPERSGKWSCPQCLDEAEFEIRGDRRVYITLDDDLEEDEWTEADSNSIEIDSFEDGAEIVYCTSCDSEAQAVGAGEKGES